MDVGKMIQELREQLEPEEKELRTLEVTVEDIRRRLREAESDLTARSDRVEAMRMSLESLEMLASLESAGPKGPDAGPTEDPPALSPTAAAGHTHSRLPRRILKLDANGKRLGTYASINQCAKAIGWTCRSVHKYIDEISAEKQLRMKGFVLRFDS